MVHHIKPDSTVHNTDTRTSLQPSSTAETTTQPTLPAMESTRTRANSMSRCFCSMKTAFGGICTQVENIFCSVRLEQIEQVEQIEQIEQVDHVEQTKPCVLDVMPFPYDTPRPMVIEQPKSTHNEHVQPCISLQHERTQARDKAIAELAPRFAAQQQPLDLPVFERRLEATLAAHSHAMHRDELPLIAYNVATQILTDNFIVCRIAASMPPQRRLSNTLHELLTHQFRTQTAEVTALATAATGDPRLGELYYAACTVIHDGVQCALVAAEVAQRVCEKGMHALLASTGMPKEQARDCKITFLRHELEKHAMRRLKLAYLSSDALEQALSPLARESFDRCTTNYHNITTLRDSKGLNPVLAHAWQLQCLDMSIKTPVNLYTTAHASGTWIGDSGYLELLLDPLASFEQITQGLDATDRLHREVVNSALGNELRPDVVARVLVAACESLMHHAPRSFGLRLLAQRQRNKSIEESLHSRCEQARAAQHEALEDRTQRLVPSEQCEQRLALKRFELFSCLMRAAKTHVQ